MNDRSFEISLKQWCEINNKEFILDEWGGLLCDNFDKPTSPNQVKCNSNDEAIWICQICGTYRYKSIKDRIGTDRLDCSNCRKKDVFLTRIKRMKSPKTELQQLLRTLKSSIPEQYIYYYLKQLFPDLEGSKKFDWLGKLSIDIFIPSLSVGIEYDGKYWHTDRTPDDLDKAKLCKKNGVDLIRVREGERQITDKYSKAILYKEERDYSNIAEPIKQILEYINSKYQLTLTTDVDIFRDKENIIEEVRTLYYHKTLAYVWPEVNDYWMYDENQGIRPEDVIIGDPHLLQLKCPVCGKKFQIKTRYYIDQRSLPTFCNCHLTKEKHKQYYDYAKKYYDQNGDLILSENSLKSRRVFDWLQLIKKYYWFELPEDERDMFRLIGVDLPYIPTTNSSHPIFK